jgi:hypothetical protein
LLDVGVADPIVELRSAVLNGIPVPVFPVVKPIGKVLAPES